MSTQLPQDPFALIDHPAFAPAGRRRLPLLGSEVELLWLPQRAGRGGVPTDDRPPVRASVVERILAEETVWRGRGAALTPNRFPFAARELLLWAEQPLREPDLELWEVALELHAAAGGTLLINSVGAAASIPRAHFHLVGETRAFLDEVSRAAFRPAYLDRAADLEVVRLEPFPALVIGLRGAVPQRARALHRLLEVRTAPSFNALAQGEWCWLLPRSPTEIPAPHFPHALGAAELWGQWCYADRDAFEAATPADLERALALSGYAGG